ncbi:MAG: orotidine-5'-phosphate decarboxylase [Candidatus Kapabacteria bacterium]|jgi:orotidine-5'-phosphate decarboxylase|nr:orotidine-5'-phosphate decarboxylase [Candidatus Kapabacteria bacterium]
MRFWQKFHRGRSQKRSILCVGLDTVFEQIPPHLQRLSVSQAITEFNRRIIASTHDIAVAYKINLAFYEQYGLDGWIAFEHTLAAIPPECIVIADAKRGDIGNTSKAYAKAFYEKYDCDALTVAPYMGQDSVAPFLEYDDKMTFVLALTSNAGSHDFQRLEVGNKALYQAVMQSTMAWTRSEGSKNLGFVVGATHPQELAELRLKYPETMFLIPGIGTQGGDLAATLQANAGAPALINVSRAVIFASQDRDFDQAARLSALSFVEQFRNVHIAVRGVQTASTASV